MHRGVQQDDSTLAGGAGNSAAIETLLEHSTTLRAAETLLQSDRGSGDTSR